MSKKKTRIINESDNPKLLPLIFQQIRLKNITSTSDLDIDFTKGQTAYHEKLQKAILYGKNVVSDPDKKAVYNASVKPGRNAFNVAVADFLSAPNIKKVDLTKYTGQPGENIIIEVTDNFQVIKVHVQIINNDGSIVEEGYGIKGPDNTWTYTATIDNDRLDGDRITVTAFDMPENVSAEVISL